MSFPYVFRGTHSPRTNRSSYPNPSNYLNLYSLQWCNYETKKHRNSERALAIVKIPGPLCLEEHRNSERVLVFLGNGSIQCSRAG